MARRSLLPLVLLALAAGGWLAWRGLGAADREQPGAVERGAAETAGGVPSPSEPLAREDADVETARAPVAAPAQAASEPDARGELAEDGLLVVRLVPSDTSAPVAGESVSLWREGSHSMKHAEGDVGTLDQVVRTDASGTCRFAVPLGMRAFLAPGGGFAWRDVATPVEPLSPGETREASVVLPVYRQWIRVEDARDGAAIAGARIVVGEREPVATGADGLAELWGAQRDLRRASLKADGYGPALFGLRPGHETPANAFVVRLSRGACLRGEVVGTDGLPASGASVRVTATGASLARTEMLTVSEGGGFSLTTFPDETWVAFTDDAGAFSSCDLPPSVPLAVSVHDGSDTLKVPEPLWLAAGEERRVAYRLGGGARVHGLVRDAAGSPVSRCTLWLTSDEPTDVFSARERQKRTARSDANGRFEFGKVPLGAWSLAPAPDSGFAPLPVPVRVTEGVPQVEVIVEARDALFVAGRVVGPTGQPSTRGYVFSDRGVDGSIDSEGRFRIGPLGPGDVRLWVHSADGCSGSEEHHAQAGQEDVLVVLGPCAVLSGRLVNGATAEPIGGTVMASADGEGSIAFATVDATGAFRIEVAHEGTYSVVARAPGDLVATLEGVDVSEGGHDDLVLRLLPCGRLCLRGPPAEEVRTYVVRRAGRILCRGDLPSEEIVTPPLPPGVLVAELVSVDRTVLHSAEVEVVAGEIVLVDFTR